MIGRKLKDMPGDMWTVVADKAGPYQNLWKLEAEDGRTTLASGYEILHYYYPVH